MSFGNTQRWAQRPLQYLLILAFFYLFILQVWEVWSFTIDDMFITLRYAKNWVAGHGIVWNIGEPPVEGYSNFSFLVLARLALSWGLNPVIVLKMVGVTGLLFSCIAIYAITRMWFSAVVALIPCFWLLAYKGEILWTVAGLETTVYQALMCSAVFFIFRGMAGARKDGNFIIAGILLALAGMTRPEAPVFMVLFVCLVWLHRPTSTTSLVLFCGTIFVCFAPYFFWRWHYFGRLFPNPVYCKGLTEYGTFILDKLYLKLIWPFALLSLAALKHNSKDVRYYFLCLPSVVYCLLLVGADPVVAFANRLFLPAFALLLPLSLQGMSILLGWYWKKTDGFDTLLFFCAILLAFFAIPMMSLAGYRDFTVNPKAGGHLRREVVNWLKHNVAKQDQVVLGDCGLIPYLSDFAFIDSYCLNNAEMTKTSSALMYQRFCETILRKKPAVIIVTNLVEDGKNFFSPTDACLSAKMSESKDYCIQKSLSSGNSHASYRYKIYRLCRVK